MKKSTNLLWLIMLALCMSLSSCVDDSDVVNPGEKDPDFKYIIVMSDIHVMAPELLENRGSAYENYLSQDPKLLEYSGEVLEYLVGETLQRNPDLVIIPGDKTASLKVESKKSTRIYFGCSSPVKGYGFLNPKFGI